MPRVAILGLGLMGGSLGLALRARAKHSFQAVGWARRPEVRKAALDRGCVEEVFEQPCDAAAGADLVVLCVPVLAMKNLLALCADSLSPQCVVTDVGSTKGDLMRSLPSVLAGRAAGFCGSHPIAGSEQQGIEAARADLYEGAVVIVTPPAPAGALAERVAPLWQAVGGEVCVMDADEHDRVMARTSHLPHLIAAALSATVGRDRAAETIARFCGPGFRDTTRIADGSPEVWRDIIETNREQVGAELEAFETVLGSLRKAVREGNMNEVVSLLADARQKRRDIMARRTANVQRGLG